MASSGVWMPSGDFVLPFGLRFASREKALPRLSFRLSLFLWVAEDSAIDGLMLFELETRLRVDWLGPGEGEGEEEPLRERGVIGVWGIAREPVDRLKV